VGNESLLRVVLSMMADAPAFWSESNIYVPVDWLDQRR
jgi:hypothetical protein